MGRATVQGVPAWLPLVVAVAFDAGCGGRSGLQLFASLRNEGGSAGRGGSGATGGVTGVGGTGGVGTGGVGTGGNGVSGSAGSIASGGVSGQGGGVAGAGSGGSGGTAGDSGGAGPAGFGGASGSAGGAGTSGVGAEGGEGGAGGEAASTPNATSVAVGAFHACAAFDDGQLRCWGTSGYIGSGNEATVGDDEPPSAVPPVDIGPNVIGISASWYHTCALLAPGRLRCFGVAGGGRLGYGNLEDIGDDEAPSSAGDVNMGGRVVQVSAGPHHSCAVLVNGKLRCWGSNASYQLGYPSLEAIGDDESPNQAGDVDVGGDVRQVVSGFAHTCALMEGGGVRCWGEGTGGRLGYGNTETIGDDETPAAAGDIDLGGPAQALAAGMLHTCALLENGSVRCWGYSAFGALGYGNVDSIGDDETPAAAGDIDLGGTAARIDAGDYATCALLVDGSVRCWGRADSGELGYANFQDIGDDETPASAGPIALGGRATSIDVGFLNVCATLESGTVRCWGRGSTAANGYANLENVGDDETPAEAGDVELWP